MLPLHENLIPSASQDAAPPSERSRPATPPTTPPVTPSTVLNSERYHRGWNKLQEIDGAAGERVIDSLQAIAPDLGTYIIEFGFGDIYSRPGLDLKSREIATVAALTALGNAQPQLKVHIQGALNVGCSQQEIVEVILQMALYAGFPAALNGMAAAKEVFAAQSED